MKSISLTKNVASDVNVSLNPMLGQLLLNNLLSNAIRHNMREGKIRVELTHEALIIQNTGFEPNVPTSELFRRFKKGNQTDKSIGIGLAIVKQICEIHHFDIDYTFQTGMHILRVGFKEINSNSRHVSAAAQPETVLLENPAPSLSL